MPIQVPEIDESSYRELQDEMLARIRVHNPEWNNYNESDPGITLLQLFAFMGESLLYRANLIPERNRSKFLTLLGRSLRPAEPAVGLVAFTNKRSQVEAPALPPDLELKAGKVPYRTTSGLDILPLDSAVYYKAKSSQSQQELEAYWQILYTDKQQQGDLVFYETQLMEPPLDAASLPELDLGSTDLVDNAAWIALLARKPAEVTEARAAIANKVLNLGIYPAPGDTPSSKILPAENAADDESPDLVYEISTGKLDAKGNPDYARLDAVADDDALSKPAVVALSLPGQAQLGVWTFSEPLTQGTGTYPPALEDSADEDRVVAWVRVRMSERARVAGLSARFHWLGINAVRVQQRAHVAAEQPGTGTGEPGQRLHLTNRPVIKDSISLTINGEAWARTDDLLAAGPEVSVQDPRQPPGMSSGPQAPSKVFEVDREAGEIRFGDGLRGARPTRDAQIRTSYNHGGGAAGNVNIGAINKGAALPAGIKPNNPLPTWGGAEAESVEEAEATLPNYLKHNDRLVTAEDFADIAQRTPGVLIGRVEVLPLFSPEIGASQLPGAVTLMVVPAQDLAHPNSPEPDQRMLEFICAHLSPRRLITTEIHVRGPEYQPLVVSVGIELVTGRDFPTVREAVNAAMRDFLSPLVGGGQGNGWPLEKRILARELWAEAARVDGVAYVNEFLLGDEAGAEKDEILLSGLQLPRLEAVETRRGDPEPLDELVGNVSATGDSGAEDNNIVPVPVIPVEC